MKKIDPALSFSNPRLLAAVYFGLLSVVGTILIDALLSFFHIKDIIPLFQAILLGMIVASITGAICGKSIIHCSKPYKVKTFWTGFVMVLLSLPFFALGLVLFMNNAESRVLSITDFQSLAYAYLVVLAYSYVLFGFLLAIGAGLAAMYLRGWLVYDILHTDKRRSMRLPRYVTAHAKAKSLHKAHAVARKRN